MSGPRHLWSGDWEDESSARAAELAAQRAHAPEDDAPGPEPIQTLRPRRRTLRDRLAALRARVANFRRRHARKLRLALLVGILTLCGAGAAYAVSTQFHSGANSHQQAGIPGPQNAWLGVEMVNSANGGVLVAKVIPGSPAAAAGIKPGDVITQIDTEPIAAPAIAAAAIDGLQPGDQVDIQLQRGANAYTAHVTLATQPKTVR
jgi:membrane-associated protease RseP (regulator of RpoE activity)